MDALPLALTGSLSARLFKVTMMGLAAFSAPLALAALGLEERWERFRVRIPLLGSFYRKSQASRFCQVLGSSLGAGLDAARSLQLALDATGNTELRPRGGPAIQRLRDGATLTEVVEWLGVLDGGGLRHLAIAERAGRVQPILEQHAQEQSEGGLRAMKVLVTLLIVLLVGFLLATNLVRVFEAQGDYSRGLQDLGRGG